LRILFPRYRPPPHFPDRCVVCGRDHPPTTAILFSKARPDGIESYSVEVPVCWRCALRLHLRRLGRGIFLYSVLVLGLAYVFTRSHSGRFGFYTVGLIVAGLNAALIWLHRVFPPAFDVEPDRDSVAFTFGELSLGYEFRAMNPEAREAGGLTSA
jgi:hypothetical protein